MKKEERLLQELEDNEATIGMLRQALKTVIVGGTSQGRIEDQLSHCEKRVKGIRKLLKISSLA